MYYSHCKITSVILVTGDTRRTFSISKIQFKKYIPVTAFPKILPFFRNELPSYPSLHLYFTRQFIIDTSATAYATSFHCLFE